MVFTEYFEIHFQIQRTMDSMHCVLLMDTHDICIHIRVEKSDEYFI